ncbi:MAG: type II toxin-antitoxin system VapB family antitoxin [Candidatus Methylomirabilales bacterium]
MRTTLTLDDKLIQELMKLTGAKTKTEAIHLAISEFIRRKKLEGLKALSGKIRIAENWQELEELELKAQEERERRWRGHR